MYSFLSNNNVPKYAGIVWQEPNHSLYDKVVSLKGGKVGNFQYIPIINDGLTLSPSHKKSTLSHYYSISVQASTVFKSISFSKDALLIIGNGPLLKDFNLKYLLQNNASIGMNAAIRYWIANNVFPTYYTCLDTVIIESLKDEIYQLIQNRASNGIKLFFLRKKILQSYSDLAEIPEVQFLDDYLVTPYFDGLSQYLTTGSFAALLGAMLGYRRMYLFGIDLNYVQQISEAKKVQRTILEITETPKNNPNYFFEDYQRKGDRYDIPDSLLNLHYQSWVEVKKRLDQFGVDVLNYNPQSRVDIFDFAL